jgi:integrase/recombinase XerD
MNKPAKTTPLREKFKRDLIIRGRSKSTCEGYVQQVRSLANYYHRSPDKLTNDEVQDYLLYLIADRKLAFSTCNQAVCSFNFLYHKTLGLNKHQFHLPMSKTSKKLPQVFSQEETITFLDAAPNIRAKAMVMLGYGAGLRISEVAHLKVDDINKARMIIEVRDGKGGYDRYVDLSEKLRQTLRQYWCVFRPKVWLFPGQIPGQPLSASGVRYNFNATLERSGIKKSVTFHSLRHSFATHLLEMGKDIRTIQRLLGHHSISSTFVYLHVAKEGVLKSNSPLDLLDWSDKD